MLRVRGRLVAAPGAVAVLGVALVQAGDALEAYLMLAAALCAALASVPLTWLRWTCQAVVVVAVGAALGAAGRGVPDVVLVVCLMLVTVVLAERFVHRMRSARQLAVRAGVEATGRAELLDAVRVLPGSSVPEAAEVVCRTLRSLGFAGAGVTRVEAGGLVPTHTEGRRDLAGPSAWTAIAEDRTVVHRELTAGDGELATGSGSGSAAAAGHEVRVVTPVRVEGTPTGAITGLWCHPYAPSDADIEVVEVLASHLGGVVAAEGRIVRQAELLERLEVLDQMRGELLGAVSDEVRDPLTILRGAGQILATHAERISAQQRLDFLERMCAQAADLGEVIDVLLDFSRSQSQRHDPVVQSVPLRELLRGLRRITGVHITAPTVRGGTPEVVVSVDTSLVCSAVALLVDLGPGGGNLEISHIVDVEDHAELWLTVPGDAMSDLVRSLVGQLFEAGGAHMDVGDHVIVRLDHATGPFLLPGHADRPAAAGVGIST